MTAFAKGVDYSTDHPDPTGLAAIGITFACRYFGVGSPAKLATADEVNELAAHKISVVANVEGAERGLLDGLQAGLTWAGRALMHADRLGMPEDRPIYLSVDFDVSDSEWPAIADALRGAERVLGLRRVGIYGGLRAITRAHDERLASWFWQTHAWSGGAWSPFAHIRQTRNNVSLVGGTVDLDEAMQPDYGQWRPGWTPAKSGGIVSLTDDQAKQLANAEHALTHMYDEDGQPDQPLHLWGLRVTSQLAELRRLLNGVANELTGNPNEPGVFALMANVANALAEIERAPLIDAVAVAQAIASRPEITDAIAGKVAERLAGIAGSISLTGQFSGGITPPSQ